VGILILMSVLRRGDLYNPSKSKDLYAIPVSLFFWALRCWETRHSAAVIRPLAKRFSLDGSTENYSSINRQIYFHRAFYAMVTMCEVGLLCRLNPVVTHDSLKAPHGFNP
jgi:hypothetical protein